MVMCLRIQIQKVAESGLDILGSEPCVRLRSRSVRQSEESRETCKASEGRDPEVQSLGLMVNPPATTWPE